MSSVPPLPARVREHPAVALCCVPSSVSLSLFMASGFKNKESLSTPTFSLSDCSTAEITAQSLSGIVCLLMLSDGVAVTRL